MAQCSKKKLSLNRPYSADVVCLLAQVRLNNYRLQVDSLQAYFTAWLDCAPQREPFPDGTTATQGRQTHQPTHPVDLRTKAQTDHLCIQRPPTDSDTQDILSLLVSFQALLCLQLLIGPRSSFANLQEIINTPRCVDAHVCQCSQTRSLQ